MVAAGYRKVTVKHIVPGSEPPTDVDYWWEQQHDRRFYTFVDEYPAGSARQSQRTSPQPRVRKPLPCLHQDISSDVRCSDHFDKHVHAA